MHRHLSVKKLFVYILFDCIYFAAAVSESVNSIDIGSGYSRILKCDGDCFLKAFLGSCHFAVLGDGMSHSVSGHLCVLLCAPCVCALCTLEYHCGASVRHCYPGISVRLCLSVCHMTELTVELFHDVAVLIGSACKHNLCMILTDLVVCIAKGTHSRLRTVGNGNVNAAHICLYGKISAGCVVYSVGEVECGTALCSVRAYILLEFVYGGKRAVIGTDYHTVILSLLIGYLYSCLIKCLKSGNHLHKAELIQLAVEGHLYVISVIILFCSLGKYGIGADALSCLNLLNIIIYAVS